MPARNITQAEIPRLPERFNFTDGHAHRGWTPEEREAARSVLTRPELLTREQQPALEGAYLDALFRVGGQSRPAHSWICSSASQAIEILANVLRLQNRRAVALVEPCFDNIADIFRRHDARLVSVRDEHYPSATLCARLPVDLDACCVVTPNNPTGAVLAERDVSRLIESCAARNAMLILDCCFRAFYPDENFDLYTLLLSSPCEWAIIEDTGKTWPTFELKGPVLSVSESLADIVFDVYSDMTLHPSPLVLSLLTALIERGGQHGLDALRGLVSANHRLLESALGDDFRIESAEFMSVAWINTSPFGGEEFASALAAEQVYVLPGRRFFWSDRGDVPYVRCALNRDRTRFEEAHPRIERAMAQLTSRKP